MAENSPSEKLDENEIASLYGMYGLMPNLIQIRAQDSWYNMPQACDPSQPAYPAPIVGVASHVQEDQFGLEFAAIQWLNLVTNAEQLFNKLLNNNIVLGSDEKDQIQRWLCLKQECEECVATEDGENHRQSLEIIEELTENTGESSSFEKSSDSQYESETESDFDSHHPDFEDKLDGYMERFKDKTDDLIRKKLEVKESEEANNENAVYGAGGGNSCYQKGRRKSLHPGSVLMLPSFAQPRDQDKGIDACSTVHSERLPRSDEGARAGLADFEPYKELKVLTSGSDAKKTQIKQVVVDLEGAQKRIEELQHTIQIKEQFIKDMIKNSETRNNAKSRFQRKWAKLEEEYYKTRTQLAQAENALHHMKSLGTYESVAAHKGQVDKYKQLARYYEKRLKDIDSMKQIAGDSAKKVLELENSLQCSRRQLEKMKKQLKLEESFKHKLELELEEDHRKMKDLQEKYSLQMSAIAESKHDGDRLKWIAEETERLNVMRESSQRLHQQLVQQQGMLDKREAFIKEKFTMEKERDKSLMEVSARITELESMLKEKASSFENTDVRDEKDQLRQEIRNLRKTRDHLMEQRSNLDEKYHKDRGLSSTEERTYLECAEAIEAIDAAIEYKNELICGRKALGSEDNLERDHGEQLLMERLLKLSPDELRTLLYKYFQKVIDLRESGRRMEEQLDETEHQIESQAWKIQELNQALQTERLDAERRIVLLQREHQEKVHLMLRTFAEESGSSGTEAGCSMVVPRDNDLSKLKRENKSLRRRLQETEAVMQTTTTTGRIKLRSRSVSPDPRHLKSLPAASPSASTKVTREKNKVIIRLNSSGSSQKSQKKDGSSSSGRKREVLTFNCHK